MWSQNMKFDMPLREFRKINISHDNNLFSLLICVIDLMNASSDSLWCILMYFMWIDIGFTTVPEMPAARPDELKKKN